MGKHSEIVAGGTPNTAHSEYWNPKEIPWMSSGEINKKVIYTTDNMISKIGFSNSSAKWVKEKSVLIALAGQGKTRGTVAITEISLTTNQSIAAIQPDDSLYYKYLFQNLKGRYDELRNISSGDGTRGGLNKQIISDLIVLAPDMNEQRKIGDFLCNLDNLITLHQRNSADFVSRFFSDFTNTWEQRKAIDIADYSKGNGYSKGDLTDAGTPIILYGRLYTKYQFAISEVDTFTVPRNGAVYSQGNEVIVPASGETADDIARASAVEKSGVLLGGDLNILRPFDFINPLFLALAISNGEPQKELAKKAQGKSVVHIHNTDIQEVTIAYPSRTEQDRIVSVFRQLDHLITLHQRESTYFTGGFYAE